MALSEKHSELASHALDIQLQKSELEKSISEFEEKKKALIKEILDAIGELLKLIGSIRKIKH